MFSSGWDGTNPTFDQEVTTVPKFIMLTRVSHDGVGSPQSLEELERDLASRIESECPEVRWLHNFAVLGPYNYVDIFEAPDNETATKISTMVRTYGKADAEIWPATDWSEYKEMLHGISRAAAPHIEVRPGSPH